MSPVSPVFNTEATVSIGLKMYSELEHPFYNIKINCLTLFWLLFGMSEEGWYWTRERSTDPYPQHNGEQK